MATSTTKKLSNASVARAVNRFFSPDLDHIRNKIEDVLSTILDSRKIFTEINGHVFCLSSYLSRTSNNHFKDFSKIYLGADRSYRPFEKFTRNSEGDNFRAMNGECLLWTGKELPKEVYRAEIEPYYLGFKPLFSSHDEDLVSEVDIFSEVIFELKIRVGLLRIPGLFDTFQDAMTTTFFNELCERKSDYELEIFLTKLYGLEDFILEVVDGIAEDKFHPRRGPEIFGFLGRLNQAALYKKILKDLST